VALNTAAKVRDEGNWSLEAWAPLIATSAELDTYIGEMLDRANNYLRYRVGTAWYTANVGSDPYDDVLKEAEMHLCQAQILVAVAGIGPSGSDVNARPHLGSAKDLLEVARFRRELAEEIILSTRAFGSVARPIEPLPVRGR
jgi:hypothetical protein